MSDGFKKFVVFILLIVVGVLCYFVVQNKDKNKVEIPETENISKKEYKERDIVFDTSYSTEDIKLPYINLDYTSINSVNYQIKNLYETNKSDISKSSYKYYTNEKTLSVLISIDINDKTNYYTYNINTENGKEIPFEEVFYKYSTSDVVLKDKIIEYIDNNEEIKNKIDGILLTEEYVADTSYNNYKANALSNNVKFFLDDKNTVNVVIKIELKEIYYEYAIFQL